MLFLPLLHMIQSHDVIYKQRYLNPGAKSWPNQNEVSHYFDPVEEEPFS